MTLAVTTSGTLAVPAMRKSGGEVLDNCLAGAAGRACGKHGMRGEHKGEAGGQARQDADDGLGIRQRV